MPSYSGVWNLVQQLQAVAAGNWPVAPLSGDIGLFGGGYTGSAYSNVIDYIQITTTGNATNFGSLTFSQSTTASCASSTRGIWASAGGGNAICYVTIATTGNATYFGDLIGAYYSRASCSSATRGLVGGGYGSFAYQAAIEYITIATTGNATSFGNLTVGRQNLAACASSTRGVFLGGNTNSPPYTNTIDYVTIATTGNAVYFGDVAGRGTASTAGGAACSNSTRGLLGGGSVNSSSRSNYIDYITIATTGNTTYFGALTNLLENLPAACASSTTAIWAGGNTGTETNVIQYVTIASTGNAVDFGDLTVSRSGVGGCSNAHGGL